VEIIAVRLECRLKGVLALWVTRDLHEFREEADDKFAAEFFCNR
jgi:hypothetical protein